MAESMNYVVLADSVSESSSDIWIWDRNGNIANKWNGRLEPGHIDEVHIVSEDPLILVTEMYDAVNMICHLINTEQDTAIYLNCDYGLWGVTRENQIVMSSRGFYGFGGTYTVLQLFNMDGGHVRDVGLNALTDVPFDLVMEWEEKYPKAKVSDFQKVIESHPGAGYDELRRIGDVELQAIR